MRLSSVVLPLLAAASLFRAGQAQSPPTFVDLEGDSARQVTVHRVARKYQGHPTTVLLPDGQTMFCVHPEGHGKGAIVLQKSGDGGRTWSAPLPVPASWATSQETPTLHRLVDRDGVARLVLFSGLRPIRMARSEDDGATWSELEPVFDFGGIVAMASVVRLANGEHAAFFHDDGRWEQPGSKRGAFTLYQTNSSDGGRSWSAPRVLWQGSDVHLCEPGVVRSPDGKRLAMLLRENRRVKNSHVCVSDDEAVTWSAPVELPASLTGDRHVGAYAVDGRLVLSFRDMAKDSPTRGDWVAWVGTFDDVANARPGQYRVRLSRNWRGTDCGYPGVEVLADGTFVVTSYGHFEPGEAPFVRSVRFTLAELDEKAKTPSPVPDRPPGTVRPTARLDEWWEKRVAQDLAAARAGGHRLVMLGDSITQGWGSTGKACWDEFWVPRRALNLGVSGDKTQHVLWRLDGGPQGGGLLDALKAANNDVRAVVVMIGTNNSNGDECTADEITAGIVAIVRRLRQALPDANVLLLDVFPRSETNDAQRQKCAAASAAAAAAFAGDARVVRRDLAAKFVGADGRLAKEVMPDFLHLSAAAYRTWAEAIVADVDRMLQ